MTEDFDYKEQIKLKKRIEKLERDTDINHSSINNLLTNIADWKDNMFDLYKKLEDKTKRINMWRLQRAEKQIKRFEDWDAESDIDDLISTTKRIEKRHDTFVKNTQIEVKELHARCSEVTTDKNVISFMKQLKKLEASLEQKDESCKRHYELDFKELKSRVKDLWVKIEKLEAETEQKQHNMNNMQSKIDYLSKKAIEFEASMEDITHTLDAFQQLRSRVGELEAKIDNFYHDHYDQNNKPNIQHLDNRMSYEWKLKVEKDTKKLESVLKQLTSVLWSERFNTYWKNSTILLLGDILKSFEVKGSEQEELKKWGFVYEKEHHDEFDIKEGSEKSVSIPASIVKMPEHLDQSVADSTEPKAEQNYYTEYVYKEKHSTEPINIHYKYDKKGAVELELVPLSDYKELIAEFLKGIYLVIKDGCSIHDLKEIWEARLK